jgi:aminocarboxymuconate-semialdehyde decarboxylase
VSNKIGSESMTVVDVHNHVIPSFVLEEAERGALFGLRVDDGWVVHPEGFRYPVTPDFWDPEEKLADMDAHGLDVAILSIAPTLFLYDEPATEAVAFARRANDAVAGMAATSPRLAGLATLPLQDPSGAAEELRRSVEELGLRGAQIGTSGADRLPLDDQALAPVLAEAERLGVPLMLHPYYVGLKPGLTDYYFTNSIGNPLDTCIAAARLIHAGTLDRHPGLRLVLVHAGGFLPYQLGRLDHAHAVRKEPRVEISAAPSSYLRRFWIDSITHADDALGFLESLIGTDRMVIGTDLPFDMADREPVERLRRAGIDPDALGTVADELFRLPSRLSA